jgi:hypothetical protein
LWLLRGAAAVVGGGVVLVVDGRVVLAGGEWADPSYEQQTTATQLNYDSQTVEIRSL